MFEAQGLRSAPWSCGLAIRDVGTLELLSVVLGSTRRPPAGAREVASRIEVGDRALMTAHPEEIASLTGLAPEQSAVIAAAFELARRVSAPAHPAVLRSPADVAAIARRELGGLRRERLLTIVCDAANRPLRTVVVADGGIDRCPFPVREILNAVLRLDGRAFALAHNHPEGDAEPGEEDVAATHAIADAARVVGLRFLGHAVVSECDWSPVGVGVTRTRG